MSTGFFEEDHRRPHPAFEERHGLTCVYSPSSSQRQPHRHLPARPLGYSRSTTLGRHTPALNPIRLASETRETQRQVKHPNQRALQPNVCRNGSTFATSKPLPITALVYPIHRGLVKTSKEKQAQMSFRACSATDLADYAHLQIFAAGAEKRGVHFGCNTFNPGSEKEDCGYCLLTFSGP